MICKLFFLKEIFAPLIDINFKLSGVDKDEKTIQYYFVYSKLE